MKQIFKKMAAGALSICMLFTGTGMQTMAGELNPEEMRPVYDDVVQQIKGALNSPKINRRIRTPLIC